MLRNRLILLGLWILSLVGISFYAGPISYGFFFVCTLTPIFALLYIFYVFVFFKIYQRLESNEPVSNTPTKYYFTLRNENITTFSSIRVTFFSTFSSINELRDDIEYELMPRDGITGETTVTCRYRGEYEIGIKKVIIRDFLNLFTITYKNRETLWVKVKPKIVYLESLNLSEEAVSSVKDSLTNTTIKDVLVRNYIPGDDIRNINWKLSARTGEMLVHNRIGEQNRAVSVIVDGKRNGTMMEDFIPVENKVLETTIALTLYFASKNTPVIMADNRDEFLMTEIDSLSQFDDFYAELCEYSFSENVNGYEEALESGILDKSFLICMIVQEWNDEARLLAIKANEASIPVVVYTIDSEVKNDEQLKLTTFVNIEHDDNLMEVM